MIDEQLKKRPICGKCGKPEGIVFFYDTVVCGECAIKLHNKANTWIQEVKL